MIGPQQEIAAGPFLAQRANVGAQMTFEDFDAAAIQLFP
jgi:hypothetical protein